MIISREDYFILPFYFQGSGLLEFGEFCQLAAKFLVEEDEEALKKELKEAFRIYDKEGEKEEALFTQYTTYNQVHKTSYFLSKPKKVHHLVCLRSTVLLRSRSVAHPQGQVTNLLFWARVRPWLDFKGIIWLNLL